VGRGPGSKTLEQLSHRRAVERLVVEWRFVPELDAERVELDDAMEVRGGARPRSSSRSSRKRIECVRGKSILCAARTALSSFSAAC